MVVVFCGGYGVVNRVIGGCVVVVGCCVRCTMVVVLSQCVLCCCHVLVLYILVYGYFLHFIKG